MDLLSLTIQSSLKLFCFFFLLFMLCLPELIYYTNSLAKRDVRYWLAAPVIQSLFGNLLKVVTLGTILGYLVFFSPFWGTSFLLLVIGIYGAIRFIFFDLRAILRQIEKMNADIGGESGPL